MKSPTFRIAGHSKEWLSHSLDIGYRLSRMLCKATVKPDLVHRNPPIAQKADLYPLHIRLIQVLEDVVVLSNPWCIFHDDTLCLAVEFDPLRIIRFLPSFLQ